MKKRGIAILLIATVFLLLTLGTTIAATILSPTSGQPVTSSSSGTTDTTYESEAEGYIKIVSCKKDNSISMGLDSYEYRLTPGVYGCDNDESEDTEYPLGYAFAQSFIEKQGIKTSLENLGVNVVILKSTDAGTNKEPVGYIFEKLPWRRFFKPIISMPETYASTSLLKGCTAGTSYEGTIFADLVGRASYDPRLNNCKETPVSLGYSLDTSPQEHAEDYLERMRSMDLATRNAPASTGTMEEGYVEVILCKKQVAIDDVPNLGTADPDRSYFFAYRYYHLAKADGTDNPCDEGFKKESSLGYAFETDFPQLTKTKALRKDPNKQASASNEIIGYVPEYAPPKNYLGPRRKYGGYVDFSDIRTCREEDMTENNKHYKAINIVDKASKLTKCPRSPAGGIIFTPEPLGAILNTLPKESAVDYLKRVIPEEKEEAEDSKEAPSSVVPPIPQALSDCVNVEFGPKDSDAMPTIWPPAIQATLSKSEIIANISSFESKIQSVICKNSCLIYQLNQQTQNLRRICSNIVPDNLIGTPGTGCIDNKYESSLAQQSLLLRQSLRDWPPSEDLPADSSDSQIISRIRTDKAMVQDIICKNSCLREKLETDFVDANCKQVSTGTPLQGGPIGGLPGGPIGGGMAQTQQPLLSGWFSRITGRIISLF